MAANYATLLRLEEIPSLSGVVPRPIFRGSIEGVLTTLESYLEGASLAVELLHADKEQNMGRFTALLTSAFEKLWELHSATWAEQTHADAMTARLHTSWTGDMALLVENEDITWEEAVVEQKTLKTLVGLSRSIAFCHGDYNPNNLLLPSPTGSVTIVDWEYGTLGCALFDLFQMVAIGYLFPASTSERIARQESLWNATNQVGAAFTSALGAYAVRMNVDRTSLRLLYHAYLRHMAAELYRQFGHRSEPMRDFWIALWNAERHKAAT